MVQALSLELLRNSVKDKYDIDQRCIVGIMLARYELLKTQKLIKENYQYWNNNTGKRLDIFWAGYGAYLPPDKESDEKIIVDFDGNRDRVYYDSLAFSTIKNELFKTLGQHYKDHIELVLVNYYNGDLHFGESFRIDLESNLDEDLCSIRTIMEWLTDICGQEFDVKTVLMKLKKEKFLEKIKGVSVSDIISVGTGIVGTL